VAGTVALFFVILAFLAGQLKSGGDPALGRSSAASQQTSQPQTTDIDPNDGFVPGGTAPAPAVPDGSSAAPTTHQS
jgi:hypothetical protein